MRKKEMVTKDNMIDKQILSTSLIVIIIMWGTVGRIYMLMLGIKDGAY